MLVEHMLFTSGATERVGSIEAGSTQSDFDPLENKRKISLSASITPLEWHGHKVNVIDVPGFPDFIGDLHAVARVVESMIIVTEAKRDLDVGFELAYDIAQRHGLATCIFVNKLERDNADFPGLLETLHARYGRKVVSTQIPIGHQAAFSGVLDLLNMKVYKGKDRGAEIEEVPSGYTAEAAERREKMMDAAAEGDDELALKYLEGETLNESEIEHGLLVGVETGRVVPILLGSAATGIGVATLLDRICGELPSPVDFADRAASTTSVDDEKRPAPKADGPLVSLCFKTTADPFVGKINYLRIFAGTLKADDHIVNATSAKDERVHNLFIPRGKHQEPVQKVVAGDICAVAKLSTAETGDTLSDKDHPLLMEPWSIPEPLLPVAIVAKSKADEDKLSQGLSRLVAEDPTLRLENNPETHQLVLWCMGEAHTDLLLDRLANRQGVAVETTDLRVPLRETIGGKGQGLGRNVKQSGGHGEYGICHIEIEPLEDSAGFEFVDKIVGGVVPRQFIPSVEKGVRWQMEQGVTAGYPMTGVRVTLYDGKAHSVDSSDMAFQKAGRLALRDAVDKAQPLLLEPVDEVDVLVPDDYVGAVMSDLSSRRGRVLGTEPVGVGRTLVRAEVPELEIIRYAIDLRSLSHGTGSFTRQYVRHEPLPSHLASKVAAEAKKE